MFETLSSLTITPGIHKVHGALGCIYLVSVREDGSGRGNILDDIARGSDLAPGESLFRFDRLRFGTDDYGLSLTFVGVRFMKDEPGQAATNVTVQSVGAIRPA
jgi:hypothetical protein